MAGFTVFIFRCASRFIACQTARLYASIETCTGSERAQDRGKVSVSCGLGPALNSYAVSGDGDVD